MRRARPTLAILGALVLAVGVAGGMSAQTAAPGSGPGPVSAINRIDLVRPDAPALGAHGNYLIGVTTRSFTNPSQIDVVNTTADGAPPVYDRTLTVEIWYPAAEGTPQGGSYSVLLRDGVTSATLTGRASRDAAPAPDRFPLVILSHGYPGNRFLLSHLGETLASKGYVVASIDHPDSTYDDQGAFGSTLVNRPWDQRFVLDSLAGLSDELGLAIDSENAAVVGYSMGGYGALIFAGGGVTQDAPSYNFSAPQRLLERNMAGSDSLSNLVDPRIKAVVAFSPWGRNTNVWDGDGLAAIEKPLMIIAGSLDDVAGYDAIRQIFAETKGTTRHLLTFENANHNAGAPIPAPLEAWANSPALNFTPFDHYADPVWDTVRLNNVSAHFVTAFLDLHLRQLADRQVYLDLVPRAQDGLWAVDDAGMPTADFSYWEGFQNRTAVGLRFETRGVGE
ncbi:alpha/beta hydrolase family protein [Flavimaricola marinus]|uniref:Alpha/beta hydrolase family protein n=1 Tax=Flavimaricola marinus TaxID=1819565 RepID=A0A238LFV5_9RHOB|nr:alpha/beta fold hydrolase [Flavimaricola marinus]SMY08498.1 Alpha/beta hydrolase family protein [Flavimaricola marinus]